MTPDQVSKIIVRIDALHEAFKDLEKEWDFESDVLDETFHYPFPQSFDDQRADVGKWLEYVEKNLSSEVSWYDRNKAIVEQYLGKQDVQTSSADWGGTEVWTLKCDQATIPNPSGDHYDPLEVLTRQCIIMTDDSDDVILTIRTDDNEETKYIDLVSIHEDEAKLHALMQVLTRHKHANS